MANQNESRRSGQNKRAHGKTTELHGDRPTKNQKLNLVTASLDDIKGVVNQVSNERADSIVRFMEFTRNDGREFLNDIPGFGPKLIGAFELFCTVDYSEEADADASLKREEEANS